MIRLAVDAGNFPRDRRGMGRVARGVVRAALADPRFAVTLLALRRGDRRALLDEFGDVPLRSAGIARRRTAFDVVWSPWNGIRIPSAAPAVVTMHDVFAFTEPAAGAVARRREQTPMRRAARDATLVIADGTFGCSEIARVLSIPPERIAVVPPAPDPFFFPALGDVLPEPLAATPFVLFVGNSEPRKNVRLAIDACARAFRSGGETLVVAGNLTEADLRFARDRRIRAGVVTADDALLRALYRNARVVVVPSFAEGFGLVAVEAMACGAAVVAANATALPEATGGAAWLIDANDADAWAAALRRLLDDDGTRSAWRAKAAARFAFADRAAPAKRVLDLLASAAARA